jgi:SAM-dependent methyltransferase
MTDDARLTAPAAARNRDPILAILPRLLPSTGLVLEVASGTGEHCAHFAAGLHHLMWQPTALPPENRASVDAWCGDLPNVRRAIALDATASAWPVDRADAVLCINMIHIAPWAATEGLLAGAARILPPGGPLILYGPFLREGVATALSNCDFDASLRARDPELGIRALRDVAAVAEGAGFGAPEVTEMPANNLTVAFRRL